MPSVLGSKIEKDCQPIVVNNPVNQPSEIICEFVVIFTPLDVEIEFVSRVSNYVDVAKLIINELYENPKIKNNDFKIIKVRVLNRTGRYDN